MREELLVIGAGPTGLAIAKGLGENGLAYVQAEATDHVGGNWAHGVYESAHIISSRKTTEYSDYPMPADYPDFPSAAQMAAYFNAYADAFDLRARIRFETPVSQVEYREDEAWDVTFGDGSRETFKGVIVCNGHHWARRFPHWAQAFKGLLLHSKDYQRADQLADQRVLVVGGGNSGADIISEAARVATRADWSLRRGYWFMPKTLFGMPSVEIMKGWLPVPVQRALIRGLMRVVVGKYTDYGLPQPTHKIFEAHPTVSTEVFHYLKHGRIHPRPDVERIEGQTVHFDDGTEAEYDVIVCATGFDIRFPFLPEGMVPVEDKIAQLYAGVFRPEYRHLYIIGTSQPRYGIGPLLRPFAELLPQWIRLQDELSVPLGHLLRALGQKPPSTHLMNPHQILRQIAIARHLTPLLRLQARRRGWLKADEPGQAVA